MTFRTSTKGFSSLRARGRWVVFGHCCFKLGAGVGFAIGRDTFFGHASSLLSRAKVARLHRGLDAHALFGHFYAQKTVMFAKVATVYFR